MHVTTPHVKYKGIMHTSFYFITHFWEQFCLGFMRDVKYVLQQSLQKKHEMLKGSK